jgi:formiminotetrahydrofolate cyclodeaminase
VSPTEQTTGSPLVNLSVAEFVAAVASASEPVPAGGSVAALSGAASAALLVLVCSVLEQHHPGAVAAQQTRARELQRRLLELVDSDAEAFRAFLAAERGSSARREATTRVAEAPLAIARGCGEVVGLAQGLDPDISGATRLDLGAASHMARAAMRSALDIAEYNLSLVADSPRKQALQSDISQLRANSEQG